MTAKARARKSKNETKAASGLIEALRFINVAQKSSGPAFATHCALFNGMAVAYDGVLSVAHRIPDELNACPNTASLLAALAKCGQGFTITHLDSGRLAVKSDKFKAFVPCVAFDEMPQVEPDAKIAVIDDRIKAALAAVVPLASETAQRVAFAATLLQANSAVATNGSVLLEYWHGIDLPPGLLLPKAAVNAILKTPKPLAGFGYSQSSATFYFDDESYIKTQLYDERYPNYESVLDAPSAPLPLPEDFFTAVAAVEPFSENNVCYFADGAMRSHAIESEGASYEIEGLPFPMAFNMQFLRMVEPSFKQVCFDKEKGKALFFGENARGAIMGYRV